MTLLPEQPSDQPEPAPAARPATRMNRVQVVATVAAAVAVFGAGLGLGWLFSKADVPLADPAPLAGPTICTAQVAVAFTTDDQMRTASSRARELHVSGAAASAEETKAQVLDRFRRLLDDPQAKLLRPEAISAILWISRTSGVELNQLAVNTWQVLQVRPQQVAVLDVKPESVGIEDPCTPATMRLPTTAPPPTSAAPSPAAPR